MEKRSLEILSEVFKDGDFNTMVTVKDFSKKLHCDVEKEWKKLIIDALGPTIVNTKVDFKVTAQFDGNVITHINTQGKKVVPYLWNSMKNAKVIRLDFEAQQNIKDRKRTHIIVRT